MTDRSNGYEGVAVEFLAGRGRAPSTAVGTRHVRDWARTLPSGAAVIDLGCGSGMPITKVLLDEGLNVYAVDASPSLVEAFRNNLPEIPVACEAVEESTFFNRMFDGVVAWGLIFLLPVDEQRRLIQRVARILVSGGRLLFTSPAEPLVWNDAMTGLESRSLGAAEYRRLLAAVGVSVSSEYEDEGQNHYFDAFKTGGGESSDHHGLTSGWSGPLKHAAAQPQAVGHWLIVRSHSIYSNLPREKIKELAGELVLAK